MGKDIIYANYNANPMGIDTNDCVIRAISLWYHNTYQRNIPLNKKYSSYDEVYRILFEEGKNNCLMLNDERCYQNVLIRKFEMEEIPLHKTMTIRDLRDINIPQNGVIVNLDGHLTYVGGDYCLYDTFDCRNEKIDSIFGWF